MFIFDICYDMRHDLKQRRGSKRTRVAAAAKRVVCFLSKVGEKPKKSVDTTNNAVEEEVTPIANMNTDDDCFDAVPICTTPRLLLHAPASVLDFDHGHGQVADLKDLFECLGANLNSNESIDNACSSEVSVCVATAMSSNIAVIETDNSASPVADFANVLAGKAYFDEAPIDAISYQSLNGVISDFGSNDTNNGNYHHDDDPDVDTGNGCSDVSSTYVMSDVTSDILEISNADTQKQLELALDEAMNEEFFGRSLIENEGSPKPRRQYSYKRAMPFATAKLPIVDKPIEYAWWRDESFSMMSFAF